MYTMLKDHKPMRDGLYRTRPVVSGNRSMNVHMNNLLSMLITPIANEAEDSEEVISSEEALARVDKANKKFLDQAVENPIGNPETCHSSLGRVTSPLVRAHPPGQGYI